MLQKIKEWYLRIPRFIRNKYTILGVAFIVWMVFFDHNNYVTQQELKQELQTLTTQKSYYQHEIEQINHDKEELFHDTTLLEKFAREKYFMKRANEEVFVIDVDTIR